MDNEQNDKSKYTDTLHEYISSYLSEKIHQHTVLG